MSDEVNKQRVINAVMTLAEEFQGLNAIVASEIIGVDTTYEDALENNETVSAVLYFSAPMEDVVAVIEHSTNYFNERLGLVHTSEVKH